MKIKLALAAVCVLLSSACVSTGGQYQNDIVYRDGSYYSPADEQNGDYYYAPEQDYDYGYYADSYDNYYYDTYRSPWYGYSNNQRCRFSYRYDRYCSMFGRGSSALHFGGFTLIINSGYSRDYYGYDHGYYDRGYYDHGYGYNSPYYYSGHSNGYGSHGYSYGYGSSYYSNPYYYYTPRPRPHDQQPRGAIAMPKPSRPNNPIIDNSISTDPGIRVRGEYATPQTQRRIARLETPTEEAVNIAQNQNGNPYTRSREPIARPKPLVIWNNIGDSNNDGERINNKQPRRIREPEPMPEYVAPVRVARKPMPVIINDNEDREAPYIRPQRQEYVREAPQRQRIERVEQIARYEQAEREQAEQRYEKPARVERAERQEPVQRYEAPVQVETNNKGPRRVNDDEADNR
jgi:hypothetical protein